LFENLVLFDGFKKPLAGKWLHLSLKSAIPCKTEQISLHNAVNVP